MKHINAMSQEKIALAQNEGAGEGLLGLLEVFNPVLFLNFAVSVLTAVNNFLVRKAETQ